MGRAIRGVEPGIQELHAIEEIRPHGGAERKEHRHDEAQQRRWTAERSSMKATPAATYAPGHTAR
jgi:hypothetical protein